MAYVNSRSASLGIWDRVQSLTVRFKDAMARRRLYTRTLHELSALSDRDLSDLGMSRADIGRVAREAANMS